MAPIFIPWGIIAILLIFIVNSFLQSRSIKQQLSALRRDGHTNRTLRLDYAGPEFRQLVIDINRILRMHRETETELRAEKQNLQWQITSIAHELRTPLTSIIGYLELMEQTKDPEERKRYMEVVRRKAERLQRLIEDFYSLSKIEDAQYPIEMESIDPVTLLEDVIMMYYEDFAQQGIKLHIHLSPSPMVRASGTELVRIVSNILQNVLKHGKDEAWISHEQTAVGWKTVISNRFTPDPDFNIHRIFDRFYSGDDARSTQRSGLGLYAAKLLAIKQGHDLTAHQEGDVLTITLHYSIESEEKGIDATR